MPTEDEDKDVVVTLDDTTAKTPEELAAEKAIDDLVAADKGDAAHKDKPADKPLTAEEGKEDLAGQLKAMRETAEAERTKRVQAEADATAARQLAESRQGDVVSKQAQIVAGAIETVTLEMDRAEQRLASAQEVGDYASAAKANRDLAVAASRLTRLEEAKAAIEANKGRQPPTHEGRVERKPAAEQDAFEQAVSTLSPASQAWARRNPACFTDPTTYKKVLAAHYAAVADDIQPDTPAYFDMLEERVGLKQKPTERTEAATPAKIRHGAPPSRDGGTGSVSRLQGNKITLTAAEREAARISGLTDQEYATQLIKLERATA